MRKPRYGESMWYLEGYSADSKRLWRFPLFELPVRIGRRPGLGLSLPSPMVSQEHAEIYLDGEELRVRDLGSTNGTFVNGDRLQADVELHDGASCTPQYRVRLASYSRTDRSHRRHADLARSGVADVGSSMPGCSTSCATVP